MLDAHATLAWVREEIEPLAADLQPALPAANTPLCEFLRDGRALCLLTAALPSSNDNNDNQQSQGDKSVVVAALPKNLQRSLHQVTTFHALERVQYFIKWCRTTAALDAYLVFSSVQLLDEQNDKIVSVCLEALRSKYRPYPKGSGLWVKKSASNLLAASEPAAASGADDEDKDGNQSTRDDASDAIGSSNNNVEQEVTASAPTSTASAAVESAPVPAPVNKLNAFLSKFPSETNVLVPVAATPVATAAVSAVNEQGTDSDAEDNNAGEDELVQAYDEDDDDDSAAPQPRAPLAGAFSPRSSFSRSSIGSSLSFSFTSDPRHHESFTDEQQQIDQSFGSVLSSPPASPKPTTRLRIPSIFERNTEKKSEDSSASTPELARASSATKDELAPRKLQIPSAFAAASSSAAATAAPAIETPPAAAVVAEASVAVPEAATPKPVSKLNIPPAFTRSASTSSSSATSERLSLEKSEVGGPASPSPPVLAKKPSRLKIPSVFAAGAASSAADAPLSSKPVAAEAAVEVAKAAAAETTTAVAKDDVIEAVRVTSVDAPITPKAANASTAPPSPFAAFISATSPMATLAPTVDAPTTPKATEARAVPRSPFAAFVSSTSPTAPPLVTRSTSNSSSTGPSAALPPPSVSRSTSSSSTTPASKLAAFLSTVEVSNAFVLPNKQTVETEAEEAAIEKDDDNERTAEQAAEQEEFSDNESDSDTSLDADADAATDSTKVSGAVHAPLSEQFSEEIAFDDDAVHVGDSRFSVSQETAIGLPSDSPVVSQGQSATATADDELDSDAEVERRSSMQFDERISEDSVVAGPDAAALDEQLTDDEPSVERISEHVSESSSDSDADADDAVRDERISELSVTDEAAHAASEVPVKVVAAASHSVVEAAAATEAEVEHHSIEHHDHANSEQPFFVVEEVSLSKPATSSKLYAFLNAVDSAQTHRFSHTSATAADGETHDEAHEAEPNAEPANDDHRAGGSVRSVASSRHSNAARKQSENVEQDESTTSEHSAEQSPRQSATSSLTLVAASDVILEKERLSGENLALQLKLQSAEDELAAKDAAFTALRTELESLKAQLAAAQDDAAAKAQAASSEFEARLAAADVSHREELAAAERARDAAVQQQALSSAQMQSITAANEAQAARIAALEEQNEQLAQQLQLAKDNEEAARYSAQVAFAARDAAEELIRSQQEQLAQFAG